MRAFGTAGCGWSHARSPAARKWNTSSARRRPQSIRTCNYCTALPCTRASPKCPAGMRHRVRFRLPRLPFRHRQARSARYARSGNRSFQAWHPSSVCLPVIAIIPIISLISPSSFVRERPLLPDDIACLVHRIDLEARAILGDMLLALLRCHATQQHDRTLDRVAAYVVERPHLAVVEAQVRLRHQRLAVAAHEAEILDAIGQIPAVVALFPFAAPAEAAHCRCRPAFVFRGERYLVGPAAQLRAIRVELAIDFIDDEVFTNQARHQAAPAAVRVDVAVFLVEQHVGLARDALLRVPLPVVAEFGIPAGILVLEPLEVLFGLGLDAPEVHRPAHGEELSYLVDIVLLDQAIPRGGYVVVVNLDAVLLQRQHV